MLSIQHYLLLPTPSSVLWQNRFSMETLVQLMEKSIFLVLSKLGRLMVIVSQILFVDFLSREEGGYVKSSWLGENSPFTTCFV